MGGQKLRKWITPFGFWSWVEKVHEYLAKVVIAEYFNWSTWRVRYRFPQVETESESGQDGGSITVDEKLRTHCPHASWHVRRDVRKLCSRFLHVLTVCYHVTTCVITRCGNHYRVMYFDMKWPSAGCWYNITGPRSACHSAESLFWC